MAYANRRLYICRYLTDPLASPEHIVGLVAGIGTAALFLRLRK